MMTRIDTRIQFDNVHCHNAINDLSVTVSLNVADGRVVSVQETPY